MGVFLTAVEVGQMQQSGARYSWNAATAVSIRPDRADITATGVEFIGGTRVFQE